MSRKLVRALCAFTVLFGFSALATVPKAAAEEVGITYEPFVKIKADGLVEVKVDVTFPGPAPEVFTQTFATAVTLPGDYEQRYVITDGLSTDAKLTVSETNRATVFSIRPEGKTKITFSYQVSGAAKPLSDGTVDVTWPLLQGLSLPVANFDAMVVPAGEFSLIDCAAGRVDALAGCGYFGGGMDGERFPRFHDSNRAAAEIVQITIRFPSGVIAPNAKVHELWTLGRAFALGPVESGVALGLLILGGLIFFGLHRRYGRDAQVGTAPKLVAEFHPVGPGESEFRVIDDVRPGQVGTVLDERVDPGDIIASVLDLAVRGHLVITELKRTSAYAPSDWALTRQPATDRLADYESTLLDAIAPLGSTTSLHDLDSSVVSVIGQVQGQLYADVAERGWFRGRPDLIRSRWFIGSLGGVIIGTLIMLGLAAWTHFAVSGLVLMILAVGMMFVAQAMPSRTVAGAALANGFGVLHGQLLTAPTDQWPKGKAYSELSKILPYAVVLGGFDRWLKALADADEDSNPDGAALSWYAAPDDWHLRDLPDSLTRFIVNVQGRIYSR